MEQKGGKNVEKKVGKKVGRKVKKSGKKKVKKKGAKKGVNKKRASDASPVACERSEPRRVRAMRAYCQIVRMILKIILALE